MPRSRSMSIRSRYWAFMSRGWTTPVNCSIRSARVDLPWSMWAMMQKFRMMAGSVAAGTGAVRAMGDTQGSLLSRAQRTGWTVPPAAAWPSCERASISATESQSPIVPRRSAHGDATAAATQAGTCDGTGAATVAAMPLRLLDRSLRTPSAIPDSRPPRPPRKPAPLRRRRPGQPRAQPAPGRLVTPYPGDFRRHRAARYAPQPERPPGSRAKSCGPGSPTKRTTRQGKDRPVLLVGRHGTYLLGLMLTSKDHDGDRRGERLRGHRRRAVGPAGPAQRGQAGPGPADRSRATSGARVPSWMPRASSWWPPATAQPPAWPGMPGAPGSANIDSCVSVQVDGPTGWPDVHLNRHPHAAVNGQPKPSTTEFPH